MAMWRGKGVATLSLPPSCCSSDQRGASGGLAFQVLSQLGLEPRVQQCAGWVGGVVTLFCPGR